jgi:hypothetical protein
MFSAPQTLAAMAGTALFAAMALAPSTAAQKAKTVVYIADQHELDKREIFAVDLKTLEVTRLNEPIVPGGEVFEDHEKVFVDRKGRHVFYVADADVDGINELFHHDAKEGTTTKISVPIIPDGDVYNDIRVDRNVRSVAYLADAEVNGMGEAYHFDVKSGVTTKLAETEDVLLDRKGRRVFYVSDSSKELWVTDTKKGESQSLSGALVDGGGVDFVRLDRNGRHAVYLADHAVDGVREISRVSVKKGEPETLNGNLIEDAEVSYFEMDAKGRRIVFIGDLETDGVEELFYAKTAGEHVRISVDVGPTGQVYDDFLVGPKGRVVVYRAHMGAGTPDELYASTLKTGEVVKLNAPLEGDDEVEWFRIDPKGRYVAYKSVPSDEELYLVELKSGDVMKLNGTLVKGGGVRNFEFGPKGRSLVYLADEEIDNVRELYHVDLKSGERTKLNPTLVEGGSVESDYCIGPRGKYVFYRAIQDIEETCEVYAVELKTGEVTKLNAPMVAGGSVEMFEVSGLDGS